MRLQLFLVLACILFGRSQAQVQLPAEAAEALRIGKLLYRSEMASWIGTDMLLQRLPNERARVGAYFSYPEGDSTRCVFVAKGEGNEVVARFGFDTTFAMATATIDTTHALLSEVERDILGIRMKALHAIQEDEEGFFQMFEGMDLNLIPLIDNGERSVYVLSGPKEGGTILLGNDYLFTFDAKGGIASRKRLHKNLIPIEYGAEGSGNMTVSMHSHLPTTGPCITATDICTLMLYCPFTSMEQHVVISSEKVSVWNCEGSSLLVLDRAAWDAMNKEEPGK